PRHLVGELPPSMIKALKTLGSKSKLLPLERVGRPASMHAPVQAQGPLLVPPPLVCRNAPAETPIPETFTHMDFPAVGGVLPRPVKVPSRRMFVSKPVTLAPAPVTPKWLAPPVIPKIVVSKTKDPLIRLLKKTIPNLKFI
ncbi:hypothetical protein RF55_25291, partial [Lasius niger]